jgi:predicted nucleic acid-binding protein
VTEDSARALLVLDTNVVLDLLVFDDPSTRTLRCALELHEAQWLATAAMRGELAHVLEYAPLRSRMASSGLDARHVLAGFDLRARQVEAPARAPVACSDPDDQKFIDLAVRHGCILLTRDAAVLSLGKRLARLGVSVLAALAPASSYSLIGGRASTLGASQ